MPESKDKASPVVHVVHDDGAHSIGVEEDGAFVPFWTVDAVTFQDRVEAYNSPEAKEQRGEA